MPRHTIKATFNTASIIISLNAFQHRKKESDYQVKVQSYYLNQFICSDIEHLKMVAQKQAEGMSDSQFLCCDSASLSMKLLSRYFMWTFI